MSSSCQKSLYNSSLFVNLIHLVIGFAKEWCMLLFTLGFTYVSVNSCCAYPFLGYCGAFARPDVTAGGGHLPTPGPPPSFWHAHGFVLEYNFNYTEDFTEIQTDWLICQGWEKLRKLREKITCMRTYETFTKGKMFSSFFSNFPN